LLLLTTRSMVVMMMRGRGNRGRRRIVVRHIVVVVRQRRAAIFRGHGTHNSVTGASQMLPGGRRRNMMGTATADASIDPVQRVLLHRLQIRDARRDLRAHRHLLHAVVFVAGTQLDIGQVSIGLGMTMALGRRLLSRLVGGGDRGIVHRRGAGY